MTKILQISNYQYPHIGGIEQTSHDISDIISGCPDTEQKIICFNENAGDGDKVCYRKETVHDCVSGVEVIRCGCFAKISSQSLSFTYQSELKKVIRDFQPDIIIFHYPNPFVAALLLPMLPSDVRFILWWHLDIVKQKFLGKLFYRQNEKLCQRADQIIATSPNYIEGSRFLSKFRNKCRVISSCIRPERFAENGQTEEKMREIRTGFAGKTVCFAIGRHVPYKGMEYLVEASKYLDDSYVILIGGKGEMTDALMKKAKGDDKVHFLGRVREEDMVAYYRACDLFCFPSVTKNEAFGLTLAEAMFFGKPAVTFTIPGSGVNYVSLSGVTGIECPNRDAKAFADAIRTLSQNQELKESCGLAAEERVKNNFLFEQFRQSVNTLLFCN